jgi:hypothetical protein
MFTIYLSDQGVPMGVKLDLCMTQSSRFLSMIVLHRGRVMHVLVT